jgi:heat shock protein HtpX
MTETPARTLDADQLAHGSFLLHVVLLLSSWVGVIVGCTLMAMTGIGIIAAVGWAMTGVWAVPLFGLFFGYIGLNWSRSRVIDNTGTTLVGKDDRLTALVRDISNQLKLPLPQVGVYPDADMNAFAAGSRPDDAVVSFSKGILAMPDDELRAIAAHEMAHVANRDMRRMQIAVSFQRSLTFYMAWTRGGQVFTRWLLGFIAELMILALSRRREYWADATAAALVGKQPMINALRRLDKDPVEPSAERLAYARLMIRANPSSWFRTHPSISDRIEAIEHETYMSRLPYISAPSAVAAQPSKAERLDPAPAPVTIAAPAPAPKKVSAPVKPAPKPVAVASPAPPLPKPPTPSKATDSANSSKSNYALALFAVTLAACIAGLLGYEEHTKQVARLQDEIGALRAAQSKEASNVTHERGSWSSERRRFAGVQSALQDEIDRLGREREKLTRERDQAIKEREQANFERSQAVRDKSIVASERDLAVLERDRLRGELQTERSRTNSPRYEPPVRTYEPPPRPYAAPPPPPPPASPPGWGALAKDANDSFSAGGSAATEEEARRNSILHCQANGPGCQIVKTFYRGCAVVANGINGGWGWATADTTEKATGEAMKTCMLRNGLCFPTWTWCSYQ